ncbi:MAG: short-chain dehydrogenase/reductase, partial [Xanthobacteraceae bacterium]
MELGLAGRRVLITGASQGIGATMALSFAREGCSVCLTSRSEEKLRAVQSSIERQTASKAEIFAIDLAERGAAQVLFERFGEVDILVNNAGAIPKGSILELDEDKWREVWELKVFGYINMTREYYRAMVRRKRGVIANIIGFTAEKLTYDYVAGSSGNACLVAFTRAVGSMSLDFGVRVLGINPGFTRTERAVRGFRIRAEKELGDAERWEELVRDELPTGAMIAPEAIADTVVFLTSDRSNAMSGHIVTIDAGHAARQQSKRTNQR